MRSFQVLNRDLSLHQNFLLEASAGTGKTFSIQNIVARLLIETSPLLLQNILIVTFTRAATKELRKRIRRHLEQSIGQLQSFLKRNSVPDSTPDYLAAFMEKGKLECESAKRNLQQALYCFDQASIFTLHGFCSKMLRDYSLEGHHRQGSVLHENHVPNAYLNQIIRDFFRVGIDRESYSVGQMAIILKEDPCHDKLRRLLTSGLEFQSYRPFPELFSRFCDLMRELKTDWQLSSDQLIADFELQAPFYRTNPKTKEKKELTLEKVRRFSLLFDKSEWSEEDFDLLMCDGSAWSLALDPSLIKKAPSGDLHYPGLTQDIKLHLEPIIDEGGSFPILLARLAGDCLKFLKRRQMDEGFLLPDDLLKNMNKALSYPPFIEKVRLRYSAAIIDEFQDTDPVQWDIFQKLFLDQHASWKGYLYLVGDPKQSIYSFRQADIYTYLKAADAIGHENCCSLDTNYRSHPSLIKALNKLFESVPKLIPIPKQAPYHLPYHPVKAGVPEDHPTIADHRGSLHFFSGAVESDSSSLTELEEEVFFPFIVNEIRHLMQHASLSFEAFTVLVQDRYQSARLASFFERHQFPYSMQRGLSLAKSPVLPAFILLLQAIVSPANLGLQKSALGTFLVGWSYGDFQHSEAGQRIQSQTHLLQSLKESWIRKGTACFLRELLRSSWHPNRNSLTENLLLKEHGQQHLSEWHQMIDKILEAHRNKSLAPEEVIAFLEQFTSWDDEEDERVQCVQDSSKKKISIITLHSSKGLEFEVVFALGLVNRKQSKELLIPVVREGRLILSADYSEEELLSHRKELDAEKMRQLYVAMTRAKMRLYVPLDHHSFKEPAKEGETAPIELFVNQWNSSPKNLPFVEFIKDHGAEHGISYSFEKPVKPILNTEELPISPHSSLYAPYSPLIPSRTDTISSFSRLTRFSSYSEPALFPPRDFNPPVKTIHTLPACRETGILIHQILEKISFQTIRELNSHVDLKPFIHPFTCMTPFESWDSIIAQMLFDAFQIAPLCYIQEEKTYRELPFVFPKDSEQNREWIKGVIDLVFMHENKYYLLDWKSTWLGYGEENYDEANLHETMVREKYHLQARIYCEALKRYLALVDIRPFEECFGGVIYCFLRGIRSPLTNGLYNAF